jgi:hypothetical protein
VAVVLVVAWVTTRLGWAQYYVLRMLYQGLEWAGWMDESKGLGGQMAGYNFWREPIWLREIANLVGTLMLIVPLLLLVLWLWERCSARWRQTMCGACGGSQWNQEGACTRCETHPAREVASEVARKMRQRWFTPAGGVVMGAGVWSASAGATLLWLMKLLDVDAFLRQRVFFELGTALGGDVMYLGVRVMGPNGPFRGEGMGPKILNVGYTYGPELVLLGVAACVTVLGARVMVSSGVVRYRGATVCGACGYSLVGVPGVKCPECGDERVSVG